jgi:hypothetical protein
MEFDMSVTHPSEHKKSLPDFSLLISRLEKQIVHQEDQAKARQMLRNNRVWKALDTDRMLIWANLAQMAGEMDAALEILAHVNLVSPENVDAWQKHLTLLAVLDKKEETAKILAHAQKYVDEQRYHQWVKAFSIPNRTISEDDIQSASLPFERLRYRQQVFKRYLDLFSGREDCFARQWVDKQQHKQGYVPVRRPMEPNDLEDHFKGLKTYGFYLLKADGSVKTAAIDVDLRTDYRGKSLKEKDWEIWSNFR